MTGESITQDALRLTERINIGGVYEVDPLRQSLDNQPVGFALFNRADCGPHTRVSITSERHRAQAQLGYIQARTAKSLVLVAACPI
ncbi:hypothetical protein C4J91_2706 [Pseudomonas sp. R3-52-08]|nr:hypothetical protein C4J91_2706 [Pseudomonas sp. R3-52-08]